ncbi:cell wall surface anchor family protein [Strigomonas culicis]|uniref:Cell wall surface anchor family protein n=1 Tax=Strigomonas culicis TaxID=28005 RepID=S9W2S6_9TRYP|nr:cell wall surface anchor family protein [Strigomonas culicis]|eukprot:EPY30120.1 cell wall surface anchor family protein [Strigomonas culicis]
MPRYPALTLFLSLVVVLSLSLVTGATYIVADVDGSVEGYEALTTIAASSYGSSLQLVTVSGATWGYAATVVRNACRFLQAAGRPSVTVSLGPYTSTGDQYASSTYHGECQDSQGFPANPAEASQRGMAFSKADVSNAFGKAVSLPLRTSTPTCTFAAAPEAKTSLLSILRLMGSSDRLVFFQLGTSSTTLSQLLTAVSAGTDAAALSAKLQKQTDVHVLETGYAGAADTAAMQAVLASVLNVSVYAPAFYLSATLLTGTRWSAFETAASRAAASTNLQWLLTAYQAKKSAMGSTFATKASAGASLMVLCALVPATLPCYLYRTTTSSIGFQLNTPVLATGYASLAMSGENVTVKSYYVYRSATAESSASRYVYVTSASTAVSGASLADSFWSAWLALLGA